MRTLKTPTENDKQEYKVKCGNKACGAVLACTKKEMTLITDARDGNAYKVVCPHCSRDTWIAVKALEKVPKVKKPEHGTAKD